MCIYIYITIYMYMFVREKVNTSSCLKQIVQRHTVQPSDIFKKQYSGMQHACRIRAVTACILLHMVLEREGIPSGSLRHGNSGWFTFLPKGSRRRPDQRTNPSLAASAPKSVTGSPRCQFGLEANSVVNTPMNHHESLSKLKNKFPERTLGLGE